MTCETCEFYITNWGDPPQTLVGKVLLENGKLRFWAKKGNESFMREIQSQKTMAYDHMFDPAKDPEGWFRSLSFQYSGSMIRAKLIKTSGRGKASLGRQGKGIADHEASGTVRPATTHRFF